MKRLFLITALALIATSCTVSKRTQFLQMPELSVTQTDSIDVAAYEEKYGDYPGAYLDIERTIEHAGTKESMLSIWTYTDIRRFRYVVLDPDATGMTTLEFRHKPKGLYMQVTTPDGRIRYYGKDDLQKHQGREGLTTYKFIFPDIARGSIVEYGAEYTGGVYFYAPLSHEIPLQYRLPCEHLKFTYAYPDWWKIHVKQIGPGRLPAYSERRVEEGHKSVLMCEDSSITAIPSEPFSPSFDEMAEYIEFRVTDMKMGDASLKQINGWHDLLGDFSKSVAKLSGKEKKAIETTTARIIEGLDDPLAKMRSIAYFVRDSIETVWDDKDLNYVKVLTEREGDPTDIAGLTKAMLDEAGLDTRFLLVHSAEDGYFDASYISYDQLSATALWVEVDEDVYVLFPYIKNLPIEHIPRRFQGQSALALEKEFVSFVTLPERDLAEHAHKEHRQVAIDETGQVTIHETMTLSGTRAYELREIIEYLSADDIDDIFAGTREFGGGHIKLDSTHVVNLKQYDDPLKIELFYSLGNLVTITPEEVIFRTSDLFTPVSDESLRVDSTNRVNPIQIDYDETFENELVIEFPEQWQLLDPPVDFEESNTFGSISAQYSLENSRLTARHTVKLNRCREPKEKIAELSRLMGGGSRLDIPSLVFTVRQPAQGL